VWLAVPLAVAVGLTGWLVAGDSEDGWQQINIAGLPAGVDADIAVQGLARSVWVSQPRTLHLPQARYVVTTNPVAVPLGTASGRGPQETFVSRGATVVVQVAYVDVVGPRPRVADYAVAGCCSSVVDGAISFSWDCTTEHQ